MESRGCQLVRLHGQFETRLCYIVKPCQPKKNSRKRLDTTMVCFFCLTLTWKLVCWENCQIKLDIGWVHFVRKIWVLFSRYCTLYGEKSHQLSISSLFLKEPLQVTVVICLNQGESQAPLKEYHHVYCFWKQAQCTDWWGCGFILG